MIDVRVGGGRQMPIYWLCSMCRCCAVCTFLFGTQNNTPVMHQTFLSSQSDLPRAALPHLPESLIALGLSQGGPCHPWINRPASCKKFVQHIVAISLYSSGSLTPQPLTTLEAANQKITRNIFELGVSKCVLFVCFLQPHLWHMEVPWAGVSTRNSHGNTRSSTFWARPGIQSASSWTLHQVLNLLSHSGNSKTCYFNLLLKYQEFPLCLSGNEPPYPWRCWFDPWPHLVGKRSSVAVSCGVG